MWVSLFFSLLVLLNVICAFYVVYFAVCMVSGHVGTVDDIADFEQYQPQFYHKILVLIPAYQEDSVIEESVKVNLRQEYPREFYDIFVIADSLKEATLQNLSQYPIKVVQVSFELSSVAKSLWAGVLAAADNEYSVVLISDADNHLKEDFLSRINGAFNQGWKAVQGHRVAKNMNTPVAVLDAASEEINNHIFRKGHRALGLSPALTGSGMAFSYSLLKNYLEGHREIGGYDKELEMYLRERHIPIAYLDKAWVYDEKVQKKEVLQRQRTRWIEAQLKQLSNYFIRGLRHFWKGDFDYANKVFHFLIPPRIILLGFVLFSFVLSFLFKVTWFTLCTGILFVLYSLTLGFSIPYAVRCRINLLQLFSTLPVIFITFIVATLNYRKAQKKFIHTPHGIESNE